MDLHVRQAVKWIARNSNVNGSIDLSPLFSYQVDQNIGQDQHDVDHTSPSELGLSLLVYFEEVLREFFANGEAGDSAGLVRCYTGQAHTIAA